MKLPESYRALRVPIPNNPLGFLLSYLIVGENGHTLIDTGWNAPVSYQSLVDQLRDYGLELKDLRQIILTHSHPDHSGLTNQIKRESGAKVFCHKLEAPVTYRAAEAEIASQMERATTHIATFGVPSEIFQNTHFSRGHRHRRPNWPEPDVLLSGGEIIAAGDTELEVIWTPGHAQGHICLYDRKNKVLFAGDHVLPVTTPHVSLLWGMSGDLDPLGDYLSSLGKLKPLEVDLVLPAHDHIYNDLRGRLDELEHHHAERLREMCESASGDWATPFDVAKRVTWTIGTFDSLPDSHKIMAVGETLAHLEFLQKRGDLAKKNENGVLLYRYEVSSNAMLR